MATYIVTTSNWNTAAFWSGIVQTADEDSLDFSGLGPSFSITHNAAFGTIFVSDGNTTYLVGDATFNGPTDASLGTGTEFTMLSEILLPGGADVLLGNERTEPLTLDGGGGNDSIKGSQSADEIAGGGGNDTLRGEDGDDTIDGDDGDDSIHGNNEDDVLSGGDGNDTLHGGLGADLLMGGDNDDIVEGNEGNDTLFGGSGNDWLRGSFDEDALYGGTGDDYLWGGWGDDTFHIENGFGNDTVDAEALVETTGDVLDLSAITDDILVDLTSVNRKAGSVTDGNGTLTFMEIETIILASGRDTLLLTDASGSDSVTGFAAPQDLGNGSFASGDRLDVTGLLNLAGFPVDVEDVTVTDSVGDGTGDAILAFPRGERITLIGVSVSQVQSPAQLNAMGIRMPTDFIIEGSDAADTIDAAYSGDPTGDFVDNGDGFLASQDDTIRGYGGDDTVRAGLGDDSVLGGADDDLLIGGGGADSLNGDAGSDILIGETRGIYHTDISAQVFRMYSAVFGREPDLGGHQSWVLQLTSEAVTLDQMAAGFVASREFQQTYGDADNTQFVTLLYNNVLDRDPDTTGLNAWITNLTNGMSRAEVVRRFAESAEHVISTADDQQTFDQTRDPTEWADDVYRLFRAVFDRDPDEAGFTGWVENLSSGRFTLDQVVTQFMASPEFQATYGAADNTQFVTLLYNNVLDREPDTTGLNAWISNLDGGMSREEVVQRFMSSPEFVIGTEADLRAYIAGFGPDDVLDPGAGDAVVAGGLFADTFVFTDDAVASTVTVTDVEAWDTLQFTGFGLSAAQILGQMTQAGDDVRFVDGTETILFANTDLGDITEGMITIA